MGLRIKRIILNKGCSQKGVDWGGNSGSVGIFHWIHRIEATVMHLLLLFILYIVTF